MTGKSFPDLPHTPANAQLYDAVMVVVSQKHSRKCTIPISSESKLGMSEGFFQEEGVNIMNLILTCISHGTVESKKWPNNSVVPEQT